jgi:outer membrane protein
MVGGKYGICLVSLIAAFVASEAVAETLTDALVQAYQSNPTLQSQRYDLKALDEAYVRARAGIRPAAELQFSGQYVGSRAGDTTQALRLVADPTVGRHLDTNQSDVRLVVEQLLYSGGKASSGIDAAAFRVQAGREALRSLEGDLLLQVVTTYADVLRDKDALDVRQTNLKSLQRQLEMTQARKIAGEVTATDVAQAEAQLEAAQAQITYAQVQLQASRAAYAALVGSNPGTLDPLPVLPLLPATLDEAFDRSETNSPELLQARFNEQESQKQIEVAKASKSLTVSARTSYGVTGELVPYYMDNQDQAWTATINVTKPIFSGGANASNYREALDRNAGDRLRIEAARRQVMQNVILAWNNIAAARQNLSVQDRQLKAAQLAALGMNEEFRYGQRSTLDLLVAEQNLRDAELSQINSKHDAYIGQATLLRQMGYLEARALLVGMELYDPSKNLRAVKEKGEVPWEGLVARADRLGGSRPQAIRIDAPPMSPEAQMATVPEETSSQPEIATVSRVAPISGTMGSAK